MGREAFTDEELVEAWAAIDGIANVARALGATYAAVNNRASRLRALGVPLRRMPLASRAGCTIAAEATPESLGIDPTEIAELVAAFRRRSG